MNDESLIPQQLDCLGREISKLTHSARSLQELREDIAKAKRSGPDFD